MNLPNNFRVCITCDTPHVENCPKCFGWGFYNEVPISANEIGDHPNDYTACPECFGDPFNFFVLLMWGNPSAPEPEGVIIN